MPTTNDRDKYDEMAKKAEIDRRDQLHCIGNAIVIVLVTSAIVTIIYLIVR